MALHAGFAAAFSITADAAQALIHAAYVNDVIPAVLKGSAPTGIAPGDTMQFDLVLAEPMLELAENAAERVSAHLEVMGTMTFKGPGKPTLTCEVHVTADLAMGVVLVVNPANVQIGLNQFDAATSNVSSHRTAGDDPKPDYGVDLEDGTTFGSWIIQALTVSGGAFLLTPPQLSRFIQVDFTFATPLGVHITEDSLNVGIDVAGRTAGVSADLVDLNRRNTSKGWKKTYQTVHTGDDEYGQPEYDTDWTATGLRRSGSHNTDVAVSLNSLVLDDIYTGIGRFEVFSQFENQRYQGILKRVAAQTAPFPHEYEPDEEGLTVLDKLDVKLKHDFLLVEGTVSNYATIAVHIDFDFKLRIVRTFFDASTDLASIYQKQSGITAEAVDINISLPGWLSFLEAIGVTAGVLLAPFTGGFSLVLVLVEVLVNAVISSITDGASNKLSGGVLDALSGFKGIISFTMPGSKGPTLVYTPNDVVVRADAVTAWFDFSQQLNHAHIELVGHGGLGGPPLANGNWDATWLEPFVVMLDDGGELFNPADPKVRIRWQVTIPDFSTPIIDTDVEIHSGAFTKLVAVDHQSPALMAVNEYNVTCRVYRPWGPNTQEIFQQTLKVTIADRLDRTHPYVHWNHTVQYEGYTAFGEPLGKQIVKRRSRIHYTDPALRCRFADHYTPHFTSADLLYLDELPFPIGEAHNHRNVVCSYCFFGGPDKSGLK